MKRLFILTLMGLMLISGCSNNPAISTKDKNDMMQTVKDYYKCIEDGKFTYVFNYLYPKNNSVMKFEITNRGSILNSVAKDTGYKVKLISISKDIKENVNTYPGIKHPDKSLFIITAKIEITYKEKVSIPIDEILLLKKDTNGVWRIKQIDSTDRYVIVRAFDYYYYGEIP